MSFNGEKAYKFVESIAFPRLTGSEGWKKSRRIIKEEFKKNGYEVLTQEFKSSKLLHVMLQALMIPIIILIFLIVWGFFFVPWISLILCALILIAVPFLGKMGSTGSTIKEPKKNYVIGENIFVRLKSENPKAHVILMSHHDSKSQVLSIVQRVACYIFLISGAILVCLTGLIFSILKIFFWMEMPIIDLLMIIFGCIAGIPAIFLSMNAVTNVSPGALDNGTAVALVVELSRVFKEKPPKNIDLTFLATDAEEMGLLGSTAFIKEFADKVYNKDTSFFLNFEAPGAKDSDFELVTSFGIPKQYTSKELNDYIRKAANLLNIKIKERYWPIGVVADHNPILNHGFKATLMDCLT
ncbi:MAG: M28 family peptidase, partial [Candidatus Helarchaeota archaeon]